MLFLEFPISKVNYINEKLLIYIALSLFIRGIPEIIIEFRIRLKNNMPCLVKFLFRNKVMKMNSRNDTCSSWNLEAPQDLKCCGASSFQEDIWSKSVWITLLFTSSMLIMCYIKEKLERNRMIDDRVIV